MIDRGTFEDEAKTRAISFRQTGKYVFMMCPIIFEELCRGGSAGTFFNREIKGRNRCRRDPERRRFGGRADL